MSKGSAVDLIYIGLGLTITAFVVILVHYLITQFRAEMPAAGLDVAYADAGLNALAIFNTGFVIITAGSGAAAIVAAFLIKSHPAFFIFTFILGIVMVFISAQFTNVWYEFATQESIAASADAFPMITQVMLNLPLIELVFSAAIAIVMYGKSYMGFGE